MMTIVICFMWGGPRARKEGVGIVDVFILSCLAALELLAACLLALVGLALAVRMFAR